MVPLHNNPSPAAIAAGEFSIDERNNVTLSLRLLKKISSIHILFTILWYNDMVYIIYRRFFHEI